uniref:Maelstrom domain-containing protein n=1 Tax=Steinernema glaseri TaxID=37863 RepID=A0A1I7Y3B9_9BILA
MSAPTQYIIHRISVWRITSTLSDSAASTDHVDQLIKSLHHCQLERVRSHLVAQTMYNFMLQAVMEEKPLKWDDVFKVKRVFAQDKAQYLKNSKVRKWIEQIVEFNDELDLPNCPPVEDEYRIYQRRNALRLFITYLKKKRCDLKNQPETERWLEKNGPDMLTTLLEEYQRIVAEADAYLGLHSKPKYFFKCMISFAYHFMKHGHPKMSVAEYLDKIKELLLQEPEQENGNKVYRKDGWKALTNKHGGHEYLASAHLDDEEYKVDHDHRMELFEDCCILEHDDKKPRTPEAVTTDFISNLEKARS